VFGAIGFAVACRMLCTYEWRTAYSSKWVCSVRWSNHHHHHHQRISSRRKSYKNFRAAMFCSNSWQNDVCSFKVVTVISEFGNGQFSPLITKRSFALYVLFIQLSCDVSVLKLHEMMPHHRPVRFRRDQQLLHSDNLTLMTPFIYSPLHLSPAKNSSTCTEQGCTGYTLTFISLFMTSVPRVGPGHPSSPLSIYFLIFSPFYFFLSFLGFTYFLLLSVPSLSTRIVPLCFQAGGRRRRPNLGLVCFFV